MSTEIKFCYFLVTFAGEYMQFTALTGELQDPTMADTCISVEVDGEIYGITCYITNKMNWEPALVEMMILQQYFKENGKEFLKEHGYAE